MSYFDYWIMFFTNSDYNLYSYILIWILGLIFWSFTTVFISRAYSEMNLFSESICPKCKNKINWYDNIPLFGWILLNWKCRSCKQEIPIFYPIIEISVCFLFLVWFYLSRQLNLNLIQSISLILMSIPVIWMMYTDWEDYLIADNHLYFFIFLSFAFLINPENQFYINIPNILYGIWYFIFFWIISYLSTLYLKYSWNKTIVNIKETDLESEQTILNKTFFWKEIGDLWILFPLSLIAISISLYTIIPIVIICLYFYYIKKQGVNFYSNLANKEENSLEAEFFDTGMWMGDSWIVLPLWFILGAVSPYALGIAFLLGIIGWFSKKIYTWNNVMPFWPYLLLWLYFWFIFYNKLNIDLLYTLFSFN